MPSNSPHLEDDYEYAVKQHQGKYYLKIDSLGIIASGDTLEEGREELVKKKKQLLDEYQKSPFSISAKSRSIDPGNDSGKDSTSFYFKAGFTGFVIWVLIQFSAAKVDTLVQDTFNKIYDKTYTLTQVLAGDVAVTLENAISPVTKIKLGRVIEDEIRKGASRPAKPEEAKELIKNIRVIVHRYKPVIDEMKTLFGDELTQAK